MAKPHILYLMTDQLRSDVLGAYGDEQCETPMLDLLAERSAIFDQHYTPCPSCVPARSSAMTGLYPHQHGALINGWFKAERQSGTVRSDVNLLPDRLSETGYRTVHVGVQHVRMSPQFELQCPNVEFIGPDSVGRHHRELQDRGLILGDMTTFREPIIDYNNGSPVVSAGTAPRVAVFPLREDMFYDAVLADKMVDVIQHHDPARPLAMFGMFWLPHPPLWAPRAFAEMVDPSQVVCPPTVGRWYGGMPVMQLANIPGQLGVHATIEQWHLVWAVYLGMVAMMDKCVGKVLAALDHAGMFEDTAIAFTSDHGDMLGSHSLYQKMVLYDEVARVPMLLKMPGQTTIRRVTELTNHLDVVATLLDIAGAEPFEQSPGKSLRPIAEGVPNHEPRPYTFAGYDGNAGRSFAHRMARNATHKLIHNVGDRNELYDMIEDPYETRNLAKKDEVQDVREELRDALNAWMDEVEDDQERC